MKHGKKYLESLTKYNPETLFTYDDAVATVKKVAFAKFDETVEVSVKLNLKKNHTVRDTVVLPNTFQGEKKILVFAKGDKADEARANGAYIVGDTELIEKIKGGWMDFDICVATPDMMKDVGKLGPVLGRRGLMPNPKTGTVTNDLVGAINELKKGRVEFRADKTGVVHLAVGKVSMTAPMINENVQVFMRELERKRPVDLKGEYIRSVALSSTMGPGVKVQFKNSAEKK
ncbi:MAG: 50S ribosomal protein L1 [Spirochaetes bacterium GWB1_48_6]|nr:MAG: 50S ribosomal protein L1 [Spirochaetes bacterium GWB1_48_6]